MKGAPERKRPLALITGAGGGLGEALVAAFLGSGYEVAAGWHERPLAKRTGVLPLRLDVTDGSGVTAAVEGFIRDHGTPAVLVNNAGITADQPLWVLAEADWDRVIAVNLSGAFRCARAVAAPMQTAGGGHIINVASHVGVQGAPGQSNYASAKAGLLGLTLALARELGAANIRVNAVLPGVLPTPMTANRPPETHAAWRRANVLGRTGEVTEVARFVAFLAGLRHVSGQMFPLDSRPLRPW